MHYELYVDSLFFLNFMMNLFALLLVDRSTLRIASSGRMAAGAGFGAAWMVLSVLGRGPGMLKLVIGGAVGTAGMLCLTFRVRGLRMFLRLLERLLLCSFGLGGAMLFLIRCLPGFRKSLTSVPGLLGMGALFLLLCRRFQKNLYAEDSLCKARLSRKGKKVQTLALIDSGNSLFEPISGKPVCVVGRELFEGLWEKREEGFRVIPYHSIGKRRGMLPGYVLQELVLEVADIEYRFMDVYVAVSDEAISTANSAEAESVNMIINPRLFAENRRGSRFMRQNERRYDTEGYDTRKNAVQDDSQR